MRFALGSDHAGFALKRRLEAHLQALGHRTLDVGAHSEDPSDYPDFAEAVARAVVGGQADRGVIACGSGVGASVAANKVRGIRAATCHDTYSARQGVEHDDMNVLVLGARVIGEQLALDLLGAFAAAEFSGDERHRRRLEKVRDLEDRFGE